MGVAKPHSLKGTGSLVTSLHKHCRRLSQVFQVIFKTVFFIEITYFSCDKLRQILKGGERMEEKELSKYLWKGLDYNRYFVIKIIPQDEDDAVIIMCSKDRENHHWCLEYMGGGKYFNTVIELIEYYNSRFKVPSHQFNIPRN